MSTLLSKRLLVSLFAIHSVSLMGIMYHNVYSFIIRNQPNVIVCSNGLCSSKGLLFMQMMENLFPFPLYWKILIEGLRARSS